MPKLVDHDARRSEIAAAAARAIDEHGLDKVRLVDVARLASCTTGAVSHYFPDKDAVLGAALDHVLGNLTDRTPETIALPAGATGIDACIALLGEILPVDEARRRDWRVWIAFCGRAVRSAKLADLHRDAYLVIQRDLADLLLEARVARSDDDAQRLAVAIVAMLDGLGLRACLEPAQWPAERLRSMLAFQLEPLLRAERGDVRDEFQPPTEASPSMEERSA